MLRNYALLDIFIPNRKTEQARKDKFSEVDFLETDYFQRNDKVIFKQDGYIYKGIVDSKLLKDKKIEYLRIKDIENVLTNQRIDNRIIKKVLVKKNI